MFTSAANLGSKFENGDSPFPATLPNRGVLVRSEASTIPGLNLYLVFVTSWFLHLGTRLSFLGLIRFDLVLISILAWLVFSRNESSNTTKSSADKMLRALVAYSVLTIPFVEWPGTVIRTGIPNFIKGIVFYYFTIAFVRTEKDLKKFLFVFVSCQLFRILDPQ